MVNGSAAKEYGTDECPSASELPENKLRHNFRLGDITWVKQSDSSWWPAQVIDEACVDNKLKKKAKYDCLVRLYGTCEYLYVDPWKSNSEFEMMLKQGNKNLMEAFRQVLEKELSCVNSSNDYEETINSKGGTTKVTTDKISSRKIRKRQDLEQQYNEEQGQKVGSPANAGVTVMKGKSGRGRHSSSTHDKEQSVDKACENSFEELRNKRQKQVAHVLDKEDCQIGASVVRREGLRRSARTNTNEYLDGAKRRALLNDMHASEDATENLTVDGTSSTHEEIKSMVRDILFEDIIAREYDAEMAYVDEVINGICSAAGDNTTGGATTSTKMSSTVTRGRGKEELDQATEDTVNQTTKTINSKGNNCNLVQENRGTGPSRIEP